MIAALLFPLTVRKLWRLSILPILTAASMAAEPPPKIGAAQTPSPRQDTLLSTGWRFLQADAPGAEARNFDDTSWKTVEVPHCWNIQPGQEGDQAHFDEGPGWYRCPIKVDAALAGKSLFLKFDAAYHSADVFVNGKAVGSHVGGFAAFCFDVTGLLRPGQENLLSVKVNYQAPFPSIPISGDFTRYPGLYRDVHLLALDPVSVSPLDAASSGIYVKQGPIDAAAARVEVTTKLRNSTAEPKTVTVRGRILDAQGAEVQKYAAEETIPAHGAADQVQSVSMLKPHLWNGRLDPYLYRLEIEVADQSGVHDRVSQPLGLRSFAATAEGGFTLNGKPYPVHGVCRHQDRFNKGWAISRADMAEDVALLLELGCTGVRLAHYPHSEVFHELCDQAGLVVWAELPLIGGGWVAKDIDDPQGKIGSVSGTELKSKAFAENARQQLSELIKQNYNHPSIVFWGLWNEIGSPKSPADKDFLTSLNALAKQLDPVRLTTAASADDKNRTTDVVGRNAYYGWYNGTPEELATELPLMQNRADGRPLIMSEYGAGGSVLQHQLNPGKVSPKGNWHPEEWQAIIHEKTWEAFSSVPHLSATFAWIGFDCSTMLRNEGDSPGRNDKGFLTADRTTRKDAFYFYKANWNPAPMAYITSRRFTPRPSGAAAVKVYSSCPEVELLINGQTQGTRRDGKNGVFVWETVSLPEGEVKVEAIAKREGKAVSDKCLWQCSPNAAPKLDLSARAKKK